MTKQEYIKEIMRGLDLKKSEKKRIEADLDSDIQAALEQGESMDEVIRRIGEPEEVAEEFMAGSGRGHHEARYVKILKFVLLACVIFVAGFLMNAVLLRITEGMGSSDYKLSLIHIYIIEQGNHQQLLAKNGFYANPVSYTHLL